ncbi:MAG: hypothetical protein AB1716_00420 [Planctomycetota bacterium]
MTGILAGLLALMGGCNHGVRWEFGRYEDVQRIGRGEGKLTFVYFRSAFSVESTDFEDRVLKDPEVLAETNAMVCVPLEIMWDEPLAHRWQLTKVPAYAIVSPDGDVLARRQNPISRDDLLKDMRATRAALAARERERIAHGPGSPGEPPPEARNTP